MSSETAFDFQAVRRDGSVETGVVMASTRDAAVAAIGSRGAFPLKLVPQAGKRAGHRRIGANDLAAGLRALATLLGSGIPLSRALTIMVDLAPRPWTAVIPEIARRVNQGERLAAALSSTSLSLPQYILGMIAAGEQGGGLAHAVERAALLMDERARTRTELRNALAYPVILAIAGTASTALLVGVVLPRFAELLLDNGQRLPAATRLVLSVGQLARFGAIPAMIAVVALLVWWGTWTRTPLGLRRWHRFLLELPVLGPIRLAAGSGKICAALSALLDAGVPLTAALPHAAKACGDSEQEARVLAALQRIAVGAAPSAALSAEQAVTQTVVGMTRLGEETGRLSDMLGNASRIESARALETVRRAIRVIEPTMILLFGGVVALVATALLQAMYGLRPG